MAESWLKINFSKVPEEIIERLSAKRTRLMEVLSVKVSALTYMLQTKVVAKLSGDVLKVRTGVLRSSVTAKTTTDGNIIRGTVESSGGPAAYGKIHEFGTAGRGWQIRSVKARALAFQMSGKTVFAKSVFHPALPPRPFMAPTLEESREQIIQELAETVAKVLTEK